MLAAKESARQRHDDARAFLDPMRRNLHRNAWEERNAQRLDRRKREEEAAAVAKQEQEAAEVEERRKRLEELYKKEQEACGGARCAARRCCIWCMGPQS